MEVFVPQHRLLLPKALFGAAKAFKEKGDHAKVASLIRDLESEFNGTPEGAAAADLLK